MAQIDLELLGLTQEELQGRVVERICEQLLDYKATEDFDEEHTEMSPWREHLDKLVLAKIDAKVEEMAEREVLPKAAEIVENVTLQQTNAWGERTGKAMTFREYLIARAEAYLTEKVNYEGKPPDGFGRVVQTRITWMVNDHLHNEIARAMKDALSTANSAIVEGIEQTVKMKLAEIAAALQVTVKTK